MKFSAVFAVAAAAATVVGAVPGVETNAQRLARGLPPNPPTRRSAAEVMAKRSKPSSPPSQCNTGSTLCCNSTGHANDGLIGLILGLLGVVIKDLTVLIGVTCSPLTVIGAGSNSCSHQPVCCTNNSFNGVIATGCSPINL
ncbi:hypothetical protein HGRIS_012111 [Hohenbuehelia grisea]|uniref:Hydrophobin n=1 Tax=Hohenbuehelia grisea TaxID=104357 RepID=A0ABR3IRA4_9AGAR